MSHTKQWRVPNAACATVLGALLLLAIAPAASAAFGFTPYAPLNTNAATDKGQDYAPSVATDGLGTWITVWQSNGKSSSAIGSEGDIFYAVSTDNGETWSDPETLNTNATTDTMQDPEPVIASGGDGNWIVVWASQENVGGTVGTDWDILFAVSSNDGATWSDPAALNTNAAADSNTDQSPTIACDKNGHWVAVWGTFDSLGNTIGNDGDILVSHSSNNGGSWSAPAALNTNAASDTAMDVAPRIASDAVDTWVTVWQVSDSSGGGFGADADVMCSRSTDDGQTWSAPTPLSDDADSDTTDEFSASLAADSSGTWMACWTSYEFSGEWEINVAYCVSPDDGVTWMGPYSLTTDGDAKTSNESPSIASDTAGTWMVVWEAWRGLEDTLGKDDDILVTLSNDDGMTWQPPRALKLNAPKDDGNDWSPCIASDAAGRWVVAWSSKDTLGDTIGKDADLLVTTTEYPQAIRILKPNGGEKYARGEKKKMTWTTKLDPNDTVRIEVWRNGSFVRRVDNSTSNDGVYKLTFPPEATPGDGYTMRVILKSDPAVFDESDAPFKVK